MLRLNTLGEIEHQVGRVLGISDWCVVTQDVIDEFARVTGDAQWLHVDRERAANGPYGTTIAHGYLVLSLVPALASTCYAIEGATTRINYGLERVRFPSPVLSGARIRLTATLTSVEVVEAGTRIVVHNVVECDGSEKPACVADTVSILIFGQSNTDKDRHRG